MAVDLSYRPAHLPRAASAASDSQTLQIANVALNNKWMKRRSFSNSFKPSESAAAPSCFCSFFTSINHKLHDGYSFMYTQRFISSARFTLKLHRLGNPLLLVLKESRRSVNKVFLPDSLSNMVYAQGYPVHLHETSWE